MALISIMTMTTKAGSPRRMTNSLLLSPVMLVLALAMNQLTTRDIATVIPKNTQRGFMVVFMNLLQPLSSARNTVASNSTISIKKIATMKKLFNAGTI